MPCIAVVVVVVADEEDDEEADTVEAKAATRMSPEVNTASASVSISETRSPVWTLASGASLTGDGGGV